MDLDGTLVRDDGTVAPQDAAALAEARERGVLLAIATGRLASGALPQARLLALDTPFICADGGALACPLTGVQLEGWGLAERTATRVLRAVEAYGLAPAVMHHDVVHCAASAGSVEALFAGWSPSVQVHRSLDGDTLARRAVLAALGAGEAGAVQRAYRELQDLERESLEVSRFPLDVAREIWVVRVRPARRGKGRAVAWLAARLGIPRRRVAAIGDAINDVDMLAWAGRSFAMSHAPDSVRAAATDVLAASCRTGGGIAEALGRWLCD